MKSIYRSLIFLLVFLTFSCDPDMVYDQFITIEDGKWGWRDEAGFEVDIDDTISIHNIYIQVRHTVEYPMSNLYMFVNVTGPTGQHIRDTVNLILAAQDGKWTGKGTGNLREIRLLYRQHTRFGQRGRYTFTIEQAMRKPELPVTDVGLRLERINP